ncbi:hypothetical protein U1Q18_045562 [Sarracenia purpurea var. burkii]
MHFLYDSVLNLAGNRWRGGPYPGISSIFDLSQQFLPVPHSRWHHRGRWLLPQVAASREISRCPGGFIRL